MTYFRYSKTPHWITIALGLSLGLVFIVFPFPWPVSRNAWMLTNLYPSIKKDYVCKNCNVVLISLDTLRADALPCYGYSRITAPNLCAFAKKNILFSNTFSQSSYTLSSTFSIFTSLYPSSHGMLVPLKDELNPQIQTLTQILKSRGYDTTYIGPTDDPALPLQRGFERGFDHIVPNSETEGWGIGYQKLLTNATLNKPTFVFFHTYMLHEPYLPGKSTQRMFTTDFYPNIPLTPESFRAFTPDLWRLVVSDLSRRLQSNGTNKEATERLQIIYRNLTRAGTIEDAKRIFEQLPEIEKESYYTSKYKASFDRNDPRQVSYLRALYDERLYQLDQELGRLFELLKNKPLSDNTIVIITADHGEEFMEHNAMFHWYNIYNTTTYVPLILRIPGVQNKKISELTQSIDILPTLTGLLNLPAQSLFEGLNLEGLILGNPKAKTNTYLLSEYSEGSVQSIRDKQWKLYIHNDTQPSTLELYDLSIDPLEQQSVISQYPDVITRLSQALLAARRSNIPKKTNTFPNWIDEEKRKKLIREGYF